MKIRKAKLEDTKKIDEIYAQGSTQEVIQQFKEVSKKSYEKDLKKHEIFRIKEFKKNMKSQKHYFIVAEKNKKIIGFGQAYIENKNLGMIDMIYVDKENRKKGAGKKIVDEMTKWLKKQKTKQIQSSCYINNKSSIRLHKKLGFKPITIKMRLER